MNQLNSEINVNISTGFNRIFRQYDLADAKSHWSMIAKQLEPDLEMTEIHKNLYVNLIKYTLADISGSYDTERSICLLGTQGTGKTLAFKILNEFNKLFPNRFILNGKVTNFNYAIYSSLEMVADYNKRGFDGLEKYLIRNVICIDDLGTEPLESVYFGSKVNVLEKIIEMRYMKNLVTHISTNLPPNLLKESYGERVFSRIKGGCNFQFLTGEDFRVKNLDNKQKINEKGNGLEVNSVEN